MDDQAKHDLQLLSDRLFNGAKLWAGISFALGVGTFGFNALGTFSNDAVALSLYGSIILATASELAKWRGDSIQAAAQSLRRKLDYRDSFGWPISAAEISDLIAGQSRAVQEKLRAETGRESYFASKKEVGTRKALENLEETTWWSKHLAGTMFLLSSAVTTVLVLAAAVILFVAFARIDSGAVRDGVSRTTISSLSLLFSIGTLRYVLGFLSFAEQSKEIERAASALLEKEELTLEDREQTIKLFQEYHLARNESPSLPTVIWKIKRGKLNALWEDYRAHSEP